LLVVLLVLSHIRDLIAIELNSKEKHAKRVQMGENEEFSMITTDWIYTNINNI